MDQKHTRENDILLGPLERPALKWLLERMPQWVTPNILTAFGFFASILIMVSYYLTNYNINFLWLASFGLVLNWFGDSLDGGLARIRNIQKPKFGYFIDHTVDAFDEVFIGVGVGLSPFVRFDFAMLALISYLLMSIYVFITTFAKGVFKISYSKVGPTEVRAFIILVNTVVYFIGNPVFTSPFGTGIIKLYDVIALAVAATLTIVFIVFTLKTGKELYYHDLNEAAKKKSEMKEISEEK